MRVRLFIDFWNFSLNWQARAPGRCDWMLVPRVLCDAAERVLQAGRLGDLRLEETRVYASYEPRREARLREWLHGFLDRQPGVRVFMVERHWRQRPVHCRFCDTGQETCRQCGKPLGRAAEKTVDARLVTDLMSLAWEGAFDVALLVSSDADFVPAIERLQERSFKVVNATWRGQGHELAAVSWASFELDSLIAIRTARPEKITASKTSNSTTRAYPNAPSTPTTSENPPRLITLAEVRTKSWKPEYPEGTMPTQETRRVRAENSTARPMA